MSDLTPTPTSGHALSTELQRLEAASDELIRTSFRAPNTRAAYDSAWQLFTAWCHGPRIQRSPLPAAPTTVRLYLQFCLSGRRAAYEAAIDAAMKEPDPSMRAERLKAAERLPKQDLTPQSIGVHLSAINLYHRMAGFPRPGEDPEVQVMWETIRRAKGSRGTAAGRGKKQAIEAAHLRLILSAIAGTRRVDVRDRALIVLGFLSGRRRSELAGMTIESIELVEDGPAVNHGLIYHVGMFERERGVGRVPQRVARTKTDQFGKHVERVFIPRGDDVSVDPVRLLRSWLERRSPQNPWLWQSCSLRNANAPLDPENIRLVVRRRILDALIAWLDADAAARLDPEVAALRSRGGRFVRSRFTPAVIERLVARYHLPRTLNPAAFGAHSLRAGFVTAARKAGKADHAIMAQTGHRTSRMLDEYTHAESSMRNSAARGLLSAPESEPS